MQPLVQGDPRHQDWRPCRGRGGVGAQDPISTKAEVPVSFQAAAGPILGEKRSCEAPLYTVLGLGVLALILFLGLFFLISLLPPFPSVGVPFPNPNPKP